MNTEVSTDTSANGRPWHVPNKWHAVPAYWEEEAVAARSDARQEIKLIDATLREGEDAVGCHLHWPTRIGLTERLDDIGVNAITLPGACEYGEQRDFVKWCRKNNIKAELSFKGPAARFPLRPNWREAVDRAAALEPDEMTLIFNWGVLDTFSDFSQGLGKPEIVAGIQEVVAYTKTRGVKVFASIADSFRTRPSTACLFYKSAVEAGADAAYCWDSRGNSTPLASRVYVSRLRKALPDTRIIIQHHNDLGMATANGMASVEAGADWLDCGVLGLADRGGLIALEEIAPALAIYGYKTSIRLEKLYDLCQYAEQAFGVKTQTWKPIAGEHWNKENGWGHRDPGDSPETSIGIAAEVVGRSFYSVIGPTVFFGRYPNMVRDLLDDWGYQYTQDDVAEVIRRAMSGAMSRRGAITIEEFKSICDGVFGQF